MSKKVQITLAILLTVVLIGVIAIVIYFIYNKSDSSTNIPEATEVREEYKQEESENPGLTTNYSIEKVQAIEDNTNIRINRSTGNIDFSESDIIDTPPGFQTISKYKDNIIGYVDNRDIIINEDNHSFSDYISNVKQDKDATIVEETNDYAIILYDAYTWCINRCPATDTTIIYMVGNTDEAAIEYIKQYRLKEVG